MARMASLKRITALAALTTGVTALWSNGSVIAPCDSSIYCHGDILEEIQLAHVFEDSKTFVDMPAKKSLREIEEAFAELDRPLKNNTALNDFLDEFFDEAGKELVEVDTDDLETDPKFLDDVDDDVIKQFTQKVIDIWPDLTRRHEPPQNASSLPKSYIQLNHTFVIAGGRFREAYYWDSYWTLLGLLRTSGSFTEISKNIILNFLDLVETIGFVPNGARIYYKNRSQPPLLARMVHDYVEYTNDTDILERAIPLLIKEHEFFTTNRSVEVEDREGKTWRLNRYNVENTQPRPESYREDYETATNGSYYAESGIIYPEATKLNDTERKELYRNLATGAESGLDYTVKFSKTPNDAARDVYFPLRNLNVVEHVPVDLNAILYGNEVFIAGFLNQTGNETGAEAWMDLANERAEAMHALLWNETLFGYYDYNITSGEQNRFIPEDEDTQDWERENAPKGMQVLFHVGGLYPFWTGSAPEYLKNNPLAVKQAYSRVERYLSKSSGGIPVTNFASGQQWDQPNVWPPLQHILMSGLQSTPATFGASDPAHNATHALALKIAQRYLDSTFCTWYATGGSTSATPRLEDIEDNEAEGIMFEKYSSEAVNTAGGGGEYEVVEGFGWTNGVLIWVVDEFKGELERPDCGDVKAANVEKRGGLGKMKGRRRAAVELPKGDARRVKRFGRRNRGAMRRL